jgi:purine-binding chemotaxis protein CheW
MYILFVREGEQSMLMTEENTLSIAKNSENLVVFRLNRIYYAIAIEAIQQIIEMVMITPVLDTESWMEGVINYHGSSIPVVNLRRHFKMEVVPYSWHTPIILVNILDRPVGLIVDDVLDVTAIAPEQIVSPCSIIPQGLPGISLLKGIIQTGDKLILMLDLAHLFDQVQVRVLSATAEAIGEQPGQTLIEKVKKSASKRRNAISKEKAIKKKKAEDVETTNGASAGMEKL